MATERTNDLINRQEAINALKEDAEWLSSQGSAWQTERMERDINILQELPVAFDCNTCYNCQHWDLNTHFEYSKDGHFCIMIENITGPEFYCAFYEKKGNKNVI